MLQKYLKRKNKCLKCFIKAEAELTQIGKEMGSQIKNNEDEIEKLSKENTELNKELVAIGSTASKIKELLK